MAIAITYATGSFFRGIHLSEDAESPLSQRKMKPRHHRSGIYSASATRPQTTTTYLRQPSTLLFHQACRGELFVKVDEPNMSNTTTGAVPAEYHTPPFPSLYWPIKSNVRFDHPKYLYYRQDVWRFTLFWTIIIFEAFHVVASLYAVAVQWRNWKLMWMVPLVYMLVAGVEAVLAGSVVGLMCVWRFGIC